MFKLFHKDDGHGSHNHDHKCGEGCNHEHHHHHEEKVQVIPPKTELLFSDFVSLFPEIELPLTLSTDAQRQFEEVHEPMNAAWMERFVLDEEVDEFTEFMACFKIPDTKNFTALVYWQASLEGNAFFLVTFSKAGNLIDQRLIAGTLYLEDGMKQLVCSIAKDWSINRVEGLLGPSGEIIKTDDPKMSFLQITLEGEILED